MVCLSACLWVAPVPLGVAHCVWRVIFRYLAAALEPIYCGGERGSQPRSQQRFKRCLRIGTGPLAFPDESLLTAGVSPSAGSPGFLQGGVPIALLFRRHERATRPPSCNQRILAGSFVPLLPAIATAAPLPRSEHLIADVYLRLVLVAESRKAAVYRLFGSQWNCVGSRRGHLSKTLGVVCWDPLTTGTPCV